MPSKRFAAGTVVPIGKTRAEIDQLLRKWKCSRVAWDDDYQGGVMALMFRWEHGGEVYVARFGVKLKTDAEIQKIAARGPWRGRQGREQKMLEARGKQEARQLLLWLKASFNAVEAGIVEAERIFLPFLVTSDGRTVAEVMVPRLEQIIRDAPQYPLLASDISL